MWRNHFILTHPRFLVPGIGEFDSSKNLNEELLLKAYNKGCSFIKLTEAGKRFYFPQEIEPEIELVTTSKPFKKPFKKGKYFKQEKPC